VTIVTILLTPLLQRMRKVHIIILIAYEKLEARNCYNDYYFYRQ